MGITISVGGNEYCMGSDYRLAMLFGKDTEDEIWLHIGMGDFQLSEFLNMCERVTDEEFCIIAANISLNQIKKGNKGK